MPTSPHHASAFDPHDQALPFIADNLAAASCFAASGASLANVGDIHGLVYSLRKTIAHLKAAAGETRDLLAATTPHVEGGRLMVDHRPDPLVPPDVDLRDMPLPRDLFVDMAVTELGMDRAEAIKLVNEVCDRREEEQRRPNRQRC